MAICFCSLAGTAACRTCSNNPNAETPPPVRTYTTFVTDPILIVGTKTNADRIRGMSDEELAKWLCVMNIDDCPDKEHELHCTDKCYECWLDWLKAEVDNG